MEDLRIWKNDFSEFKTYLSSFKHHIVFKKKGQTINAIGEGFTHHFYILSGYVISYFIHESGHVRNARCVLSKDSFFPLYYPVQIETAEASSFVADVDTKLLVFDHKIIDYCLNDNADFNRTMYDALGQMINQLAVELADQVFLSGMENLCRFLYLSVNNPDKPGCELPFTQTEIGNYVGMNRSNTARCLKFLRDEAIIETGRNKISIKKPEKLLEIALNRVVENIEN